jgi:hypothetical protein
MDISYERNVSEVFTAIISNVITIVLLGVFFGARAALSFSINKALIEKGIAFPIWWIYFRALLD